MSTPSDPSSDDSFAVALDAEGLRARSVVGSLWTAVSQGLKVLVQVGSQILLARLLFPSDFGLVAMASPIVSFLQIFKDIGLSQAIVQQNTITQEQVSGLFWMNLAISGLLTLLLVILAPIAAFVYREPPLALVIVALSLMLPISALAVHPSSLMARRMQFKWVAAIDAGSSVVGLAVVAACALGGLGYWSLVAGQLANSVVNLTMNWTVCGWAPSRPKLSPTVWQDLRTGANITGANVATFVTTFADNMIVGLTAGPVALGLYDRSYRLVVQPVSQLISPLSRVAVPLLSRLNEQPEEYRKAYMAIFRSLLLITLPGLLVCMSDSPAVIDVLLGRRWAAAIPIFPWLCLGGVTSGIYSSAFWLLLSQGRAATLRNYATASSIINLASFLIGSFWGVLGIAIGAAVGFVFVTTPLMLYGATRSGPVSSRNLLAGALPFFAQGGAVFALLDLTLARLNLAAALRLAIELPSAYVAFALTSLLIPSQRTLILRAARAAWDLLISRLTNGPSDPAPRPALAPEL